jgi:uncharacterized membrane protein YbhN (UPF0104 family)
MEHFLEQHSGELTILAMTVLVLATLLIVVPQLLRAYHHATEMEHAERMRALEQGQSLPPPEHLSRLGGRVAFLVPIVVICAAGTVTCFLVAYKTDSSFSVALVVWIIAGAVSLAAVTGGVALMGRLAPKSREEDEPTTDNPLEG